MRPSNSLKNKIYSDTYWRVPLVCKKIQAHSSSEQPLVHNQDKTHLMEQGWAWPS